MAKVNSCFSCCLKPELSIISYILHYIIQNTIWLLNASLSSLFNVSHFKVFFSSTFSPVKPRLNTKNSNKWNFQVTRFLFKCVNHSSQPNSILWPNYSSNMWTKINHRWKITNYKLERNMKFITRPYLLKLNNSNQIMINFDI